MYNDCLNIIIFDEDGCIKSKHCDSSGVASLCHDRRTFIDSQTKTNILNDQFVSVFFQEPPDMELPDMGPSPYPSCPDIDISTTGIIKLKSCKASRPGSLPAHLLKVTANEISAALRLIFQASLHQHTIPNDCKTASIIPLFKMGDHANPANYRSIMSICCKILEHVLHSTIITHLESQKILC